MLKGCYEMVHWKNACKKFPLFEELKELSEPGQRVLVGIGGKLGFGWLWDFRNKVVRQKIND